MEDSDAQSQQDELQEQTGQTVSRVAESVLEGEDDDVMDDGLLKLSVKRKSTETKANTVQTNKVSKKESELL